VLAAAPGGPPAAVLAGGASGSVLLVLLVAAAIVVGMRRSLRRRRLTSGSPDDRITGAWSEFTDALRLAGRPVPTHLAATEAAAYAVAPAPPKRGLLRRATPETAAAEPPPPDATTTTDATTTAGEAGRAGRAGDEDLIGRPAASRSANGRRRPPADVAEAPLPPLDELVAGINTVGFAPGAADHGQADRAGRQAVTYADALRARRSWWRRAWWSVRPGPLRWRRAASKPGTSPQKAQVPGA
jgi:hypothetical protein